jgi:hypothetical protein
VNAGVVAKRIGLVIAERIQRDTGIGEGFGSFLQLDQLRAARRSPHRRPIGHEHGGPTSTISVHVDVLIGVSTSNDVGEHLTDSRPSREFTDRILAGPDACEAVSALITQFVQMA